MFQKKSNFIAIEREVFEDLQADVRGLKKLAGLTEDTAKAQARAFAVTIDTLEARVAELASLVASVAELAASNGSELSERLNRTAAAVGALQMEFAGLGARDSEKPVSGHPGAIAGMTTEQEENPVMEELRKRGALDTVPMTDLTASQVVARSNMITEQVIAEGAGARALTEAES